MALEKKTIVKRQYSRAGCIECKRRKVKCNEVHPSCATCTRVRVPCVYPDPNYRNKARKTVVKSEAHDDSVVPPISSTDGKIVNSPSADGSLQMAPESFDMGLFDNVIDDANNLVHGLADFDIVAMQRRYSNSNSATILDTSPTTDNLKPFHSNIILNEPTTDNILFNEDELRDYLLNGVDLSTNDELNRFWNQFNGFLNDAAEEDNVKVTNLDLILQISEKYKLSPEEQTYFKEIMLLQLYLYIFPFASSIEDNELAHVLLEYCLVFKFLVYALLSLSASCHFTITKDRKHDRCQKKFTVICMKLVVFAFEDLKNNEHSLWHIEGLIITVLVLTMLFSDMSFVDSTKVPVSWVLHLKEAKSLLVKYNTVKSQVQPSKPETPGILMAKLLFFCYDWISKLSMPVAEVSGKEINELWTLTRESNIFLWDLDYYRSFAKLGFMIPPSTTHTGFNLFTALTSEVVDAMYKLLDLMASLASVQAGEKLPQVEPEKLCVLMGAIGRLFQQEIVPGATSEAKYLIDITNPAHPYYRGAGILEPLPTAAYGKDSENPLDVKYYSYCDVAQRLHGYFLYLKVLTTPGLMYVPRNHPVLQIIVKKIISLMFFVKSKKEPSYSPQGAVAESENYYLPKCLFDLRTIMIQLPFRMCIDLTDSEDDFEKLDLFFRGLLKLGSGNCSVAVHKIKKNRELASRGTQGQNRSEFNYLLELFPIY